METVSFDQVVRRGCGLDVHKETVVATIDGEGLERSTREFGTFTSSLTELKDWLVENKITHVARRARVFTGSRFIISLSQPVLLFGLSMPGT
jgi:hypothetical protein